MSISGCESTSSSLARVAATLPRLEISTPIVFCHGMFGPNDDLKLRRPAPNLPEERFWHQADFEPLLVSLFARTRTDLAVPCLTNHFRRKLASFEHVAKEYYE